MPLVQEGGLFGGEFGGKGLLDVLRVVELDWQGLSSDLR